MKRVSNLGTEIVVESILFIPCSFCNLSLIRDSQERSNMLGENEARATVCLIYGEFSERR